MCFSQSRMRRRITSFSVVHHLWKPASRMPDSSLLSRKFSAASDMRSRSRSILSSSAFIVRIRPGSSLWQRDVIRQYALQTAAADSSSRQQQTVAAGRRHQQCSIDGLDAIHGSRHTASGCAAQTALGGPRPPRLQPPCSMTKCTDNSADDSAVHLIHLNSWRARRVVTSS